MKCGEALQRHSPSCPCSDLPCPPGVSFVRACLGRGWIRAPLMRCNAGSGRLCARLLAAASPQRRICLRLLAARCPFWSRVLPPSINDFMYTTCTLIVFSSPPAPSRPPPHLPTSSPDLTLVEGIHSRAGRAAKGCREVRVLPDTGPVRRTLKGQRGLRVILQKDCLLTECTRSLLPRPLIL